MLEVYYIYTIHHDSRPCMYIHVLIFYFVLCVAMEEHKIEKNKKKIYFLNGREEKTSALLGHTQHFFLFVCWRAGIFKCLIYFFFSISSQSFFVSLFSLRLPQQQQQKKRYLTHPDEHWPDMDRCTCFNCWMGYSHDSSLFNFFVIFSRESNNNMTFSKKLPCVSTHKKNWNDVVPMISWWKQKRKTHGQNIFTQ
jgi:hypothetical protein